MICTYQDFESATDVPGFIMAAINAYRSCETYKTAKVADLYDAQRNQTIFEVVPRIFTVAGAKVPDFTASNNKIASNFFNRLNTQRCMYSLGAGISFIDPYEAASGKPDTTKEMLGPHFDHDALEAGYHALIHGVSYMLRDIGRVHVFKATELVPLYDEDDGSLRAAIRFWQLDESRPLNVVLYEVDGYTTYRAVDGKLKVVRDKTAYRVTYQYTDADGVAVPINEDNYGSLPIVPMYGSRLKQSTLVGMREAIDAYDLVKSGFANDMTDCAQVYWILENYGGMDDDDLKRFLDRLRINHVATVDNSVGDGRIAPYAQEIPHEAREALLAEIRNGIYEDFGALDVHAVAAGATNDHIDAAYQPLDENAADFEHWVSDAIIQLLRLSGVDDTPVFHRTRISNQLEQVQMVVQEAAWLDEATVLRKLPNVTTDEANAIMAANVSGEMRRMGIGQGVEQGEDGIA